METIKKLLGERIKNSRERLGISQKTLAEKMGFPAHQIISQIETGSRDIKAWELSKLAGILNVDFTELLSFNKSEYKSIILWRDLPDDRKEEKETHFKKKCHEYHQLEKAASIKSHSDLPTFDIDIKTIDYNKVNQLASKVNKELNLGQRPAMSLEKVLEDQYGVKIWYDDLGEKGSAASTWGSFGPAILMNRNHAPWRRNYSFAHELFHLIIWKSAPPEIFINDQTLFEKFEKFANAFASSVLLPADSVLNEVEKYVDNNAISYVDLVSIARDFDVSTEALLYRLFNLKRIERKTIDNTLDNQEFKKIDSCTMHEKWWNPPPLPERFVMLGFLAYRKGNISRARLAEFFDTSLFEINNKFREYGFYEDEDYEIQISTV
jgi:Zn-dependent peptidase ImmA (M78 family)/transcriptional regulator with XRE-family HTH domain